MGYSALALTRTQEWRGCAGIVIPSSCLPEPLTATFCTGLGHLRISTGLSVREERSSQPLLIGLVGRHARTPHLYTFTLLPTVEGTSPRPTSSYVSPYRMSVFFQEASLHFLRSSVHLSMKHKNSSTLEFCGFEEKK